MIIKTISTQLRIVWNFRPIAQWVSRKSQRVSPEIGTRCIIRCITSTSSQTCGAFGEDKLRASWEEILKGRKQVGRQHEQADPRKQEQRKGGRKKGRKLGRKKRKGNQARTMPVDLNNMTRICSCYHRSQGTSRLPDCLPAGGCRPTCVGVALAFQPLRSL